MSFTMTYDCYTDSFDTEINCEEVYAEDGYHGTPQVNEDDCIPFDV